MPASGSGPGLGCRLREQFGYRHVGTFTEQGYKFGRYWDVAWFERAFPDRVGEEAS